MEGITGFEEKLGLLLAEARRKKQVLMYKGILSLCGEESPSAAQLDRL